MKQFLVTHKVKSIPNYLEKAETLKDRIFKICDKYDFKREKVFVLDEEEKNTAVIVTGDIKKMVAFAQDPEWREISSELGIIPDTVRTDVYGAHAIRLRILSEMESSIARVLVNESSEEEEIILAGGEDGKIQPEICYR